MADVLDLSGADTRGFDAMPSGTYPATIYEAEMRETQGKEGAKLPGGTPVVNVQFRIADGHEFENRRAFRAYTLPPKEIDGKPYEHYAKMNGIFVRFLTDAGYTEADVTSGKFKFDLEDLKGRPIGVTLKRKQKYGTQPEDNEWDNEVSGTKPIDQVHAAGASTGIL